MSDENNGGPAFPGTYEEYDLENDRWRSVSNGGMTLRDYFAAKALPACFDETWRICIVDGWPPDWSDGVAQDAYKIADSMLKARQK